MEDRLQKVIPLLQQRSQPNINSKSTPSTIYSNSPFPDPAIISYSPAPIQQQSYPLSSPYGVSRASSPYVNLQQQHIDVQVPTKISQTTSTGDSDSKYDEEETTTNGYEENSKRTVNGNHDSSGVESDVASYSHKKSSRRKKNQNSNGQYQNLRTHPSPARKFRRGRRQIHEWAGGDVNDFKSEEFDFQGNLDLFDKEKVFAEIRELDSTAPENLLFQLVNPSFYHTDEEDETANDGEVDSDGSWKKKKKANGGDHRKVKIRTLTGVACPTVQPLQMVEVERIAALETGPNEDQMIENAGRGASMMCLQALGGSRQTDLLKSVAFQQKILLPTSGKIVKTVEDLPQQFTNPVDLIVDALLGYQFTLRDIVDEHDKRLICDLMDWANNNKAPVLSLDMPSGVNGNTGSPVNSAHYIHPKWTLCLGAPKVDRIGVKGWGMPWGSEYLVGLEYST
ncbi:unnamed protein product [Rhizophagus irregularis]|nr:unnamed protein product [Rhizophagus irregularis]